MKLLSRLRPFMLSTLAFLAITASARAETAVVLVEPNVAPYREARDAAMARLRGAREVNVNDASAADQLKDAAVVLAIGHKAYKLARQAAPSVPTVVCMVLGVRANEMGNEVTAVPLETDPSAFFAQARLLMPSLKRVGLLANPQTSELLIQEAQRTAAKAGVQLKVQTVSAAKEVTGAVQQLSGEVDALWLAPDPRLFPKELLAFVLNFASERKLPLFGFLDGFTQAGALASVSPNPAAIGDRAAQLALETLSRPPERRTPVPPPSFVRGNLTVNLSTAKALGVNVSSQATAAAKQVF